MHSVYLYQLVNGKARVRYAEMRCIVSISAIVSKETLGSAAGQGLTSTPTSGLLAFTTAPTSDINGAVQRFYT